MSGVVVGTSFNGMAGFNTALPLANVAASAGTDPHCARIDHTHPPSPASSANFASLTSGTNTTAAMIVGSGGDLSYAGTGVINASALGGQAPSYYYPASNPAGYITITSVPVVSTIAPLMDGTATIGASGKWADGAHVHPTDTSRQASYANLTTIGSLANTAGLLRNDGTGVFTYDTTAYLSGTKVDSFNTRTGVVTLTSLDVTNALAYTPYNATNPSGYQVNVLEGVTGTAPIVVGAVTAKSQAISINAATTLLPGSMSAADKAKLDGVATGATANLGTVTSVAALTLGTTGTDLSSSVATGTTTPVITLNVPTASAANRGALSAADWSTFNGKQAALNGTGLVRMAGTVVSYDNAAYITGITSGMVTTALSYTPINKAGDSGIGDLSMGALTASGASNLQNSVLYSGPTPGSNLGTLFISTGDPGNYKKYGLMFGVSGNGDTWMQNQRVDGDTYTYNLQIQPAGGSTVFGNGSGPVSMGALTATSASIAGPVTPGSYTVATLPAGTAGMMAYASDARKTGEGAGAGTGLLLVYTKSAWRDPSQNYSTPSV